MPLRSRLSTSTLASIGVIFARCTRQCPIDRHRIGDLPLFKHIHMRMCVIRNRRAPSYGCQLAARRLAKLAQIARTRRELDEHAVLFEDAPELRVIRRREHIEHRVAAAVRQRDVGQIADEIRRPAYRPSPPAERPPSPDQIRCGSCFFPGRRSADSIPRRIPRPPQRGIRPAQYFSSASPMAATTGANTPASNAFARLSNSSFL